ncbi:MAG: lipopolysaccharide heptosyltransferase II [Candidatus Rokubacteria bacterium]|nr:lipopolysaccharide heptosyltransferase II [Candidatus Rokubacteria bacterium]
MITGAPPGHDLARTILVRAPNWLGDTVMALPALSSLRAGHPDARITVLGPWAALLRGQGVADVLLPYPPAAGERRAVTAHLRADPADLALVLPNSLGSAVAAWRWGARRRIGFDTDARRGFLTDAPALPLPRRHQVDEYLLLAETAGAPPARAVPRWTPAGGEAPETREVEALWTELGLPAAAPPVVGLHLGAAAGAAKQWDAERYGHLARLLHGAGLTPLLMGSPREAHAAEIASSAAGAIASAVGRDRPALLPALLSRLACVVSGDTGIAHLGAAVGIPTVTLFGPTDPDLTAPRGGAARLVRHEVPCAPCFLEECPIDHPCMRSIEPAEVMVEVLGALARATAAPMSASLP